MQPTYELCFGEAYFEYFESCDFSREITNIDVSVFMFDLRMINMSSECEYDWYWKISACSTEYEVCDSFSSLTRHQTKEFYPLVLWIWNQNIAISTIVGTSSHNMISICYLDVNWLIPKISACRARIWSLVTSERRERVTNFIFCRAGWYFSVPDNIYLSYYGTKSQLW
jgi:hypothetical protein